MSLPSVFISISAILGAVFWLRYAAAEPSWIKTWVKTGSIALLALVALLLEAPMLAIALAFGALGDFCLSRKGDTWFLAGMGAFAGAHLVYLVLLLPFGAVGARPVLLGALAVFGVVMALALWGKAGTLRVPVLAYLVVILLMVAAALGLPAPYAVLIFAAVTFAVSDTLLATELFLLPKDHSAQRLLPYLVWPTYWAAQFAFLIGFTWFAWN